jgi:hypothetical protein
MRAVHSFDPCLPCGVHMYGKGKVRKVVHTPTGMARWRRSAPSRSARRGASRSSPRRSRTLADPALGLRRRAGRRGRAAVRRGPRADLRRARRADPDALAQDGVVASLMLIHGLYPVDLRRGCRRRWTACARTWSPTAATSSCSGSRTGSRGCA